MGDCILDLESKLQSCMNKVVWIRNIKTVSPDKNGEADLKIFRLTIDVIDIGLNLIAE
jgi:hypothetical protein